MEGEIIRKKLKNYVRKTGIKYNYIANKINIHKSTLSHFINADRKVSKQTINKIKNYLVQNNII
ncbi:hypothetical protein CLOACE_20340 [Clostridium acetireducens DSM 10703]|uniref:HTH cro/C1-type domain-containing protein n=1 Tax=Clostridium acetireducens DSM 10703 TaxID=1121290 RepID=A0A1E8EX70_9CLOT|nr:helix-turn-helix transcriptional regulator [Clostridium acetireducens]OFI04963.1 hypothetical protein CLOACE_20340 [Clostridium acetireducens DSM 10703]